MIELTEAGREKLARMFGAWHVYSRDPGTLSWVDVTSHVQDDQTAVPSFEVILTHALRWKQQGQSIRLEYVQPDK